MTPLPTQPELSFWEKLDLIPGYLSIISTLLYTSATGVFRGKSGAKQYNVHVFHSAVRRMCDRLSLRQAQYIAPPSSAAYEEYMKENNLPAETVTLPHGTVGHWFGKKDAKNVLIYYHGGGFALAASAGHFNFVNNLITTLNNNGHDVALFFLAYTLTPSASYPTQLRQSVEALRYILSDQSRSPSSVLVGGDSAGGNLALATLLHLSHPHPEIDPLPITEKLAGVFAFAPWVSFRPDWPSLEGNRYKDIIPKEALMKWSAAYLNGKEADAWSEPMLRRRSGGRMCLSNG
ncbi:hypothetical protein PHISCL_08422 [Aspergillus sclerotialis]|uniref:Alpha/beta hydrolase fold-3 domain-containing protein n=1 Tax=Aspergillus sclerotialis TaxID=2070753 RepID=A0A3A2ZIR5_9EURO|nr:hypothetical protein PHISCL_08422 [Aspergillus sclerotialis]